MKSDIRLTLIGIIAVLLTGTSLFGYQFKHGKEIYLTEDYQEDLILGGTTINFAGNIWGDIIAAARTVTFDGMMDGNLNAAGQRITVNGQICRSLRCFAQNVNINSRIDGDVLVFAAQATLANESVVGRDCGFYVADLFIDGTVNGNVTISAGTVTIAGKINGDVTIAADHISISPEAVIAGDLNYSSKERATISPQAQLQSEPKWKKRTRSGESSQEGSWIPFPSDLLWSTIFLVGSLILGAVMILMKRDLIDNLTEEIRTNAIIDGLIGLLVILIIPIALVLIAVTLVGLPVALVGLSLYGLVFLFAKILAGITVGMVLLSLVKKGGRISLGWSLLVGMILLAVLYKIPILGLIVYLIAWAVGAGAIAMLLFRKKKDAAIAGISSHA